MASAQVVETSVNTNKSPSQNYTTNPDNHSNHNNLPIVYVLQTNGGDNPLVEHHAQAGFRKNRSITYQAIRLIHHIESAFLLNEKYGLVVMTRLQVTTLAPWPVPEVATLPP